MSEDEILKFPCELPIKVFGKNEPGFRQAAVAIVRAHVPMLVDAQISAQESRGGRFVSLTIRALLERRAQADAVYRDLVACERVLMVL
jgi:uncharacterized protein